MKQPPDHPLHDQPASRYSGGDDVINIISGVQSELDKLKNAQRKQATEQATLNAMRTELDRRQKELDEKSAAIEAERATIDERSVALEAKSQELAQAQQAIERAGAAMDEQARQIEARQAELQQQAQALELRRAELEDQARILTEREGTLAEAQAAFDAKQEELDAAAARLAEESAALNQQQTRFREKQRAMEQSLAAKQQEVDDRERELAAEKTGIEQASRSAKALKQDLEQQLAQLRADQEEVEREQQRLEQQRAQLVELQTRLEHAAQEAHDQQGRIEELEGQIQSLTEQLAKAQASAGDPDAVKALQSELAAAREESQALLNRFDEAVESRQALESQLAQAQEREAALQAQFASEGGADGAEGHSAVAELEAQLEKREQAIEALAGQLRAAKEEITALRANGGASGGLSAGLSAGGGAFDAALRRERLARVRAALDRRSRKIAQAKDAILARQKELEHLAQQRQTFASQKAELDRREQQIAVKAAKSRGMTAVFLGALSILALGVMSWAVVDRVFPATYTASATIAADESRGVLTQDQAQAWADYCTQLAMDPRLIEVASDRMRRRGILELASAGALASRLKTDLDLSSPKPGSITMTFKGEGAERTQRLLDTYIAALVSVANDARERRMDGASTIVAQGAKVDGEPIHDPRLMYAGIGWGASSGLLLFFALVVWIRLSLARRKFEEENAQMLTVGGQHFS